MSITCSASPLAPVRRWLQASGYGLQERQTVVRGHIAGSGFPGARSLEPGAGAQVPATIALANRSVL